MPHPLQRLDADDIRLARTVLAKHGLVGGQPRFAYLGLEEPPKQEVLAFKPGEPVERRVRAILLDMGTGAATDVVASLTRAAIDSSVELDPAVDGQPPIMLEDLVAVDEIARATAAGGRPWPAAASPSSTWSAPARCRPGRSASRARRAGACCGCCPSCRSTRRTTRGPIRSTARSPTSTWSSAGCCT